jgi:hypothetical protein
MYGKLKNFGKIVKNKFGPTMSSRGDSPSLENRDKSCLLPQVRQKKCSEIG